jgi:hypothetical protein
LLALDGVTVGFWVALEPLETLSGHGFDGGLLLIGELSLELLLVEGVLHLEAVVLESVLGLDLLLDDLVLSLELLGILDHLLDILFGESTLVVGDGNLVLLTSALIDGGDVKNTVGIDIEGDLDLWNTSWSWWDTLKVEFTELMVVLGHLSLTLEDLDQDTWLVILVSGESLGLLGWDGSVSLNDISHDTTSGLDTHGKWGDIEEQKLLGLFVTLTGEDGSLDGGTVSNSLIWVDGFVKGLSVEEVGEHGLNLWDSGRSTDENDLVDLTFTNTGVLEDVLDWWHALSEEVHAELLELGSGDVGVVVLTFGKSLALNWGLMRSGENSLGLLALSSESSESSGVLGDIDTRFLLEVSHAEVDELVVEILTTPVSVTVGGLDLEDTFLNGEEGDIESTTTKIEDEDVLFLLRLSIETVGNGCGGWLVDDSENVESRDGSGILGGLSLGVVEISWDSDDGRLDGLSEVGFGDFLHLDQNHGGDFLSLEFLGLALVLDDDSWLIVGTSLDFEWPELDISLDGLLSKLSADKSLSIEDSVGWVSGSLVLSRVADESLLVSEGDVGWGGVQTLIVGDDFDLVVHPHSDAGVGGSEIDSNSSISRSHLLVKLCF